MLGPALTAAAYLLGSVSFGLIAAERAGVDLRAQGSGNIGATNVGRVLGKKTGRVVLALDLAKGLLPALAAWGLLGLDDPWTAGVGVAAVVGHCYPIWHRLQGGKGAATSAGVMLALVPIAGLGALITYVGLKKLTKRASVGSLAGALVGALVTAILVGMGPRTYMTSAILVVVILRHADNLARLVKGEEPPS